MNQSVINNKVKQKQIAVDLKDESKAKVAFYKNSPTSLKTHFLRYLNLDLS